MVLFQRVSSPAGCQKGGQKLKPVETEGQRPVGAELSKQFGFTVLHQVRVKRKAKETQMKAIPFPDVPPEMGVGP